MEQFINAETFATVAGCVAIVVGLTQVAKPHINVPPLVLNVGVSTVVGVTRIATIGDYSPQAITLGLFNIIPIALASAGAFDFATSILEKKE